MRVWFPDPVLRAPALSEPTAQPAPGRLGLLSLPLHPPARSGIEKRFQCDVYVVVEIGCAALAIQQHPSPTIETLISLLGIASGILGVATILLIRADLLKHYNEREPIGIYLDVFMTLFFSFFYLQSQLYPIAQFKKRKAEGYATAAGRTLLP